MKMTKVAQTHVSALLFSGWAYGHYLLAASLIFGVSGQLLLKFAIDTVRAQPAAWLSYAWLVAGFGVYAVGVCSWMLCLGYLDLSYAYPFTGLNYVMVLAASWLLFDEHVSVQRIIGVVIICVGVTLIPTRTGGNA